MSARAALALSLAVLAGLAGASGAHAARLIGGRAEAALEHAFTASHPGALIVSVRRSTVAPAWSVVRWTTARLSAAAPGPVRSSYFRGARPGEPPAPVAADLSRDLRIEVVYAGSGSETVAYGATYRGGCGAAGAVIDAETLTVTPMTWTVRYTLDLDRLDAAAGGALGAVTVPDVAFDARASHLSAEQTQTRTLQDGGCNARPQTTTCHTRFTLGGADAAGALSLVPGAGLTVGLPLVPHATGACSPTAYTLGPSLWASRGATAAVTALGLGGGALPANPYRPVPVSWPANSGAPLLASPCAGGASACIGTFAWRGLVRLVPIG